MKSNGWDLQETDKAREVGEAFSGTPTERAGSTVFCLRTVTWSPKEGVGQGLCECTWSPWFLSSWPTWVELLPPLSWRAEEPGKGFLLEPPQRTGNPSAAKLGPGDAVTVPSTALGRLPLKISQWLKESLCEQTKENEDS